MFDATDAAARRSWVTSPYRSVEGNCFVARSEEHTSELQSLAYLVCRLIISEEHTSELQSLAYLVCRLLLEKKKTNIRRTPTHGSSNGPRESARIIATRRMRPHTASVTVKGS